MSENAIKIKKQQGALTENYCGLCLNWVSTGSEQPLIPAAAVLGREGGGGHLAAVSFLIWDISQYSVECVGEIAGAKPDSLKQQISHHIPLGSLLMNIGQRSPETAGWD